jgi:hypothetical protein
LGIPVLQQFDNEAAVRGGQSHRRVIGQVVRLCLFVGVEVLFIAEHEAKRNHWVEGFHALGVKAFWSRKRFRHVGDVPALLSLALSAPSLAGKTPMQMRRGFQAVRLTAGLRRLIRHRLSISQGRVYFIRKVDVMGKVHMLNETWSIGRPWIGEYVWGVVDTAQQTLSFWHKPQPQAAWKHIKTRPYRLIEIVHPLLPEFRRNRLRCRAQWPG